MEDDEMELKEEILDDGANYMLMRVEIAEYLLNLNGKVTALMFYLLDCDKKGIAPDIDLMVKMIDIVRRFNGEPEDG